MRDSVLLSFCVCVELCVCVCRMSGPGGAGTTMESFVCRHDVGRVATARRAQLVSVRCRVLLCGGQYVVRWAVDRAHCILVFVAGVVLINEEQNLF